MHSIVSGDVPGADNVMFDIAGCSSRRQNNYAQHSQTTGFDQLSTAYDIARRCLMLDPVPEQRIRRLGEHAAAPQQEYVLYWMTAYRRVFWNYSLQRAVEWACELSKPLVIFEALRCGYRWANDRIHAFLMDGMADNAAHVRRARVMYYPYLEPQPDAGRGLLAALAARAAVVVTDDFPCFFLPRMYAAAARQIPVCFELVDSNGLLPLRAATKVFARAFDFRRFLQKNLLDHLVAMPAATPLTGLRIPQLDRLPAAVTRRWPAADLAACAIPTDRLRHFPIDHSVQPGSLRGGTRAAQQTLCQFLDRNLVRYADERNQPDDDVASGLSPYLHAGHISAHEVFHQVTASDNWDPTRITGKATGSAEGWWGASRPVEAFLDELVTWREIGFNMCALRDDFDQYDSLPAWARQTLAKHSRDRREHVYSLEQFDAAETHDPLWNAAQRQLRREGKIHNYLRMLWGKKILEWSLRPEDALHSLIELNNKYALDGRDPNSYSGIFWCLGRYDRAWGPERPVFGTVRYMSSENTARKLRVREYVARYAE
jgi:deoxyribodipyrimidine photo-lyase